MSKIEQARLEYQGFLDLFQSLVLSTANPQGIPNASYAPFVVDEFHNFYIYVSGLSTHTQNLQINPQASVLFLEDEAQTQQIFARRRLTFNCNTTFIERESEQWLKIINLFGAKFGDIIKLFRDLPDFRIFQLTPQEGRFVIGFGAAYQVNLAGETDLLPIQGKSHSQS
ncbi:MAG: pyridoxamine 5'-phosphate oxidase family protein [Jaaginema sp. PMC 1080.18]|nr:pyridoxamine 5'-phosphate oxidase family protein [Jaaginema sp. PMC 1080.18]MEC4866748.1 pyridoxamine 5'-phosphate oxidase family protein [Jaaginema sp. PMC 1078.18]